MSDAVSAIAAQMIQKTQNNLNNNTMETTKIDVKALVEKWKPVLDFQNDQVAPITESRRRETTAILLENEAQYLKEDQNLAQTGGVFGTHQPTGGAFSGDRYAAGDSRVPKIVIPMVRRTFPELITNEIVGVQPMSGPVGLAFALRYKYLGEPLDRNVLDPAEKYQYARPTGWPLNDGTTGTSGNAQPHWVDGAGLPEASGKYPNGYGEWTTKKAPSGMEAGYNFLDTRYTGVEAEEYGQALSAFDIPSSVSGAAEKAEFVKKSLLIKQDRGVARLLSQFEMTGRIPQMTIKIEKTAVEAGTRRIAANWSTELEQDLKAMNGIDIDNEMTQSLSYEIQAEIDREMLTRMIHICVKAGYKPTSTGRGISFWDAGQADGRWLGERCRAFYAQIIVEANRMAVYNRRGAANFIVATPRVCALLEMLPDFKGFPVGSSVNTNQTGVAKVGTVGGRFTVYRDTRTEAQYDMGAREDPLEYALLGYKGAEYYDTGIVFCPYIPVMMQRVVDPNTFAPKIGLMTRYGVVDHIFGADMFYHMILVTGLGLDANGAAQIPAWADTTAKRVFL